MISMRDGVRLAADIYRPEGIEGPLPVLLERTPYDRRGTSHADCTATDPVPRSKPEMAAAFAAQGYVYVLQDCRGRYGSEGGFTKYANEAEDGFDTLSWLMAQPWCDGRIGTLGLSYSAHVQAAAACLDPPGLAALFMDSGGFSSAFHSGVRQGGAFELKQLTWAVKHARLAPASLADPARRAALEAEDIRDWIGVNPWRIGVSPLGAAPEYDAFVAGMWARETLTDFWRAPDFCSACHDDTFTDAPMVFMSSWYDPYALAATENFSRLSRCKQGPVRLVMGPWTHGQRSVTWAGDVDFGPGGTLDGQIAPDYVALRRAWFDRHLAGREAPDYLAAPVTLFVMGGGSGQRTAEGRLDHGGRWRTQTDWPATDTRLVDYQLHSDGRLAVAPAATGTCSWRHDPFDPVPTTGGAVASGAPLMEAGGYDQRETAEMFGATRPGRAFSERDDVLVFQTEPLTEALEVVGPITACLSVSSSAVDTDVMIKLIDVYPPSDDYPGGYALNLTHGVLRLRFRDGFDVPRLMVPGDVYDVEIQAFPTANLFAVGHRIRLDVASSNFPHFDVNPGTGVAAGESSAPVVAINRIHTGRAASSRLVLPIAPRPAG
ncbi:MAG: CocE/NonD family hydrolase [Brevundimonas sp.]|nr:CocE/NonD family hydrolase [Brevundimonas sp.]MDI1280696.1 CocE/NonD family hydrolase [Brevundimonas sp.]